MDPTDPDPQQRFSAKKTSTAGPIISFLDWLPPSTQVC
jgi:hypothetical protein